MNKRTIIFIMYIGALFAFYQVMKLGSLAVEGWITIESQKMSIERHRLIYQICEDGQGYFKGETLTCGVPEQTEAKLL